MRTVPLHGKLAAGRVALVDDEDYDLVMAYRWHVMEQQCGPGRRPKGPYAATRASGHERSRFMHKLITGWPRTDHADHNGLNNQRANLRPATNAQNSHNKRPRLHGSSQFKGVMWKPRNRKWQASIGTGDQFRYLGLFTSEEAAARAFDVAALELYGEYAYLNFGGDAPADTTAGLRPGDAPERVLTGRDVAALFRVDPKTITRWAKAGKLTVAARTPGGHGRYRESDVLALFASVNPQAGAA